MTFENEGEAQLATEASRTMGEAHALTSLVSALTPLDQVARIRLLRTIATFFELNLREVLPDVPRLQHNGPEIGTEGERRSVSSPTFSEDRSVSPKVFLLEKRPQSDVERIACLAYYLTHYRNQATFKTLELSKLNTEAAQIKLSNPTRAVDNAAGSHFLLPAGQGKKQISAIGELYVQALPDRMAAKEAVADIKRRRTKGKSRITGAEGRYASQDAGEDGAVDGESDEEL